MKEIYVFGHQRPDTDSICSAIAYTNFKREQGVENINAYRLNNVNKETKFVLDYFDVSEPKLLDDLDLKVDDLNLYKPEAISKNDPVKKVWDLLVESKGSRIIPCVDENGRLEGIVSVGDITQLFMDVQYENITDKYEILFKNFTSLMKPRVTFGEYNNEILKGKIIVGAQNSYDDITNDDLLVTSRLDQALECLETTNCGCLVVPNGIDISSLENVRENCCVIGIDGDIFSVVTNIKRAVSIKSIMRNDELTIISSNSYVEDAKLILQTSSHRNFPVVDENNKLFGIISRRHLIDFEKKQAILIDHNERKQSVEGIENAEILEIVDHHRVADVQTDSPILIRSEPVGCTATIVYKMYIENNVPISGKMAGLMLSAILSDTLKFSSPTCTDEDMISAKKLAKICEVNIDDFSKEMFKAGTSIKDISFDELLSMDCKVFNISEQEIYIAQINTLDIDDIDDRKEEYTIAMDKFCKRTNCALLILMVTDIINTGSKLIIYGKLRSIAERAFNIPPNENSVYLDGVMSRKKQVVPTLIKASREV